MLWYELQGTSFRLLLLRMCLDAKFFFLRLRYCEVRQRKSLFSLPNCKMNRSPTLNIGRENTRLNGLVTQLKVISQVQQGDKIATQENVFSIDSNSMMQGAFRKYKGETRDRNIQSVTNVVLEVIEHVRTAVETRHQVAKEQQRGMAEMSCDQFIQRTLNDLSACRSGLNNLTLTYSGDARIVSQLKTVSEQVDDFLARCADYGMEPESVTSQTCA